MSFTKQGVEKNNAKPLYSANKFGQVMRRSIGEYNEEDGTASYSIGFPVCEVPEYVEPRYETAQLIAELLNRNEEAQK